MQRIASARILLVAASVMLIGAGCAKQPELELPMTAPEGAVAPSPAPSVSQGESMPSEKAPAAAVPTPARPTVPTAPSAGEPYYIAYSAEEYARAKSAGRPVVLYFWAGWCPICRAEEPKLKQWIEESALPVSGFRVDFDTQQDLKAEFKIPYQHTTIILDTRGNVSERFSGPVERDVLLAALKTASER